MDCDRHRRDRNGLPAAIPLRAFLLHCTAWTWRRIRLVQAVFDAANFVWLCRAFLRSQNSYYRWKRRRAARKFEVYMRKHDQVVHFDEHGNYIPPDDDKKNGGGKSGWVN